MGSSDTDFDTFYAATRRGLLLQTFALTGDLPAATAGVREAYTRAWHHWRKVSAREDREQWVRPLAWQYAARRHRARLGHRDRHLEPAQVTVLDAVASLPSRQRRTLVLTHLAGAPLAVTARELGVTVARVEEALQAGTASFAVALDTDSTSIRRHLESLAPAATPARLPRAPTVRRSGRRRRRSHTVGLTLAAVAATLVGGMVAHQPDEGRATTTGRAIHDTPRRDRADTATTPVAHPQALTPARLLDADQVARLGGDGEAWAVSRTDDNTSGNGLHTMCQGARFADPHGVAELVRRFAAVGRHDRTAVQSVEVSTDLTHARRAYRTTVGWYAGCRVARLQLLHTWEVRGIGDEARMLSFHSWQHPVTTYTVAVARTGRITTSTVARARGVQAPAAHQIAQSLADAVVMLCGMPAGGECARPPDVARVPPSPSGGAPGMLAVVDLPPVGRLDKPWVGTDAITGNTNPAATTCDHADFHQAAGHVRSRSFLIPEAQIPRRFGLSETVGRFGDTRSAHRLLGRVSRRMQRCERHDLASTVHRVSASHDRSQDRETAVWRVKTEVSQKQTVHFWMALVRVGPRVAQVGFSPAPGADLTRRAFLALAQRAADRLTELGEAPGPGTPHGR